jgi:hypothetical protein
MNVTDFKKHLKGLDELIFETPAGLVPAHFHVTEIGLHIKQYVDCGGQMRSEKKASMQLWVADDLDHRLSSEKLIGIVESSELLFGIELLELEVEYQGQTIERYGLQFENGIFKLLSLKTDCLAPDLCGIPLKTSDKKKVNLAELTQSSCCTPGGGCC